MRFALLAAKMVAEGLGADNPLFYGYSIAIKHEEVSSLFP